VTPCYPITVHRRFGGTYFLRLQGRRLCEASNQPDIGSKQSLLAGESDGKPETENGRLVAFAAMKSFRAISRINMTDCPRSCHHCQGNVTKYLPTACALPFQKMILLLLLLIIIIIIIIIMSRVCMIVNGVWIGE
jgi:hypothetical protein